MSLQDNLTDIIEAVRKFPPLERWPQLAAVIDFADELNKNSLRLRGREAAELSKACFEAAVFPKQSFFFKRISRRQSTREESEESSENLSRRAHAEWDLAPFRASSLWNQATALVFEDYQRTRSSRFKRWLIPSEQLQATRWLKKLGSVGLKEARQPMEPEYLKQIITRYQFDDKKRYHEDVVATFDYPYYLKWIWKNLDFGVSPIRHFEQIFVVKPWLRPHPLFATDWFIHFYPEYHYRNENPFFFFVTEGWKNGYDPGPDFSTKSYLDCFPELIEKGTNPLRHAATHPHEAHDWMLNHPIEASSTPKALKEMPEKLDVPPLPRIICSYRLESFSGTGNISPTALSESARRPTPPLFAGHSPLHPDSTAGYSLSSKNEIALAKNAGIDAFAIKLEDPDQIPQSRAFISSVEEALFSFLIEFASSVDPHNENVRSFVEDSLGSACYFQLREASVIVADHCLSSSIASLVVNPLITLVRNDKVNEENQLPLRSIDQGAGARVRNDQVQWFDDAICGVVFDYLDVAQHAVSDISRFGGIPTVTPGFDTSQSGCEEPVIFHRHQPSIFEQWLQAALQGGAHEGAEILFIESWNDWDKANALLPSSAHGFSYLNAIPQAISRVLSDIAGYRAERRKFEETPVAKPENRVALVFHVYYIDLLDEVCQIIRILNSVADPFLTMPHYHVETVRSELTRQRLDAVIIPSWNWGRDVRPFLDAFRFILNRGYEYFLKLHTKKSDHRSDGSAWRKSLYQTLVGETEDAKAVVRFFDRFSDVGIIGSGEFLKPVDAYLFANRSNLMKLLDLHGFDLSLPQTRFFAGTMFWGRCKALDNIQIESCMDEFEPELFQVDGTLAHAFERFFSILAENNGFRFCPLSEVQLANSQTSA